MLPVNNHFVAASSFSFPSTSVSQQATTQDKFSQIFIIFIYYLFLSIISLDLDKPTSYNPRQVLLDI